MNRKRLFNVLRVVVSVGLIVFVCRKIRFNDTLVTKEGTQLTGRLLETGPDRFVIDTREQGTVPFGREQLRHEGGHLTGVHRGIITVFRDIDLVWFIPTFLLVGLVPTVGAFRFYLLLTVQGVKVRLRRALGLTFLGYFFNNFMLGLTGGDVVKAYYVARDTHKRTEAVVTVFLDRAVGLIVLALIAGTMVMIHINDPKFRAVAIYVWLFLLMACFVLLMLYSRRLRRNVHYTVLVVGGVGGGLILFSRWWMLGWAAVWHEVVVFLGAVGVFAVFSLVGGLRRLLRLHKLRERLARSKLVREMDQTFHVFAQRPWQGGVAVLISSFCHFVSIASVFGFARALGIRAEFHYFLVFVPVIVMVSALPVSLAGWGVQEAAYQVFFGSVGVGATEAITLSFVYRLCAAVLWSLPGGVVLMLNKDRASVEEVRRAMREKDAAS